MRTRADRRERVLVVGLMLVVLELLLAAVVSVVFLAPEATGKQLGIGEVLTLTKGRHVSEATIRDSDGTVVGEATPGGAALPEGGRFHAALPSDGSLTPSLTALLAATGADVRVDPQESRMRLRGVLVLVVTGLVLAEALGLVLLAAPRRTGRHEATARGQRQAQLRAAALGLIPVSEGEVLHALVDGDVVAVHSPGRVSIVRFGPDDTVLERWEVPATRGRR